MGTIKNKKDCVEVIFDGDDLPNHKVIMKMRDKYVITNLSLETAILYIAWRVINKAGLSKNIKTMNVDSAEIKVRLKKEDGK